MAAKFRMRLNRNKVSLITSTFAKDIPAYVATPLIRANRKTPYRFWSPKGDGGRRCAEVPTERSWS